MKNKNHITLYLIFVKISTLKLNLLFIMNIRNSNVYEMAYQKCTNESSTLLFTENNYNSRKFFIKSMRDEVDKELTDFKGNSENKMKTDILFLYEDIHKESHLHLDSMELEFIEKGIAHFDEYIFLSVTEKTLISLSVE